MSTENELALHKVCNALHDAVGGCLEQMSQASGLISENDLEWKRAMEDAEKAHALKIPQVGVVNSVGTVRKAPTIITPVFIEKGTKSQHFLIAGDAELILSTFDATKDELEQIATALNSRAAARMFFDELMGSVETLTGIVDEHGARTLADLMFLYSAIMHGGFIDHYPGESNVLEIASALPSGEQWSKFIKVEYMQQGNEGSKC